MSSDTKKKFLELLREAETEDELVKEVYKLMVKEGIKFRIIEGDELEAKIRLFGYRLFERIKLEGLSFAELVSATQKLLKFIGQIEEKTKLLDFDCQDPIGDLGITFDDIAGQETVKEDLEINYIYPFIFPKLFTSKSQGILLYGPPGTGKTLLARAATAEIKGAAFFAPSPGELRGKYEGETEKNIDQLFKCAQAKIDEPGSPYKFAIIFIDEFDSLAGAGRETDPGMRRSVNALLQAMDGIKKQPNVSVIAATNFPTSIDAAILRRFGAMIFVDLPDDESREWLLRASLAENYSLPNVPETERKKDLMKSNIYLKNIKQWGSRYCVIKTEGGILTREKKEIQIVDKKFIKKIVNRTGLTSEGEDVVKKIKAGTYVDPDDYEDKAPMFGYSASDITKMMDIAVQKASFTALWGSFSETIILVLIEENPKKKLVPSEEKPLVPSEIWYVAVPPEDELGTYTATPEAQKEIKRKTKLLSPNQQKKALNFSMCQEYIEKAVEEYPSTIKNAEYIKLLLYKYRVAR
uniref:AAA family ATPase n=1 Tax=Marseillevirus LCMAC102 TaxID=2506603 RepID=A0A481YTC7_9VIRU|nr:MAG: AAA family ATPase [Marseillevirus LCMAC102]